MSLRKNSYVYRLIFALDNSFERLGTAIWSSAD